MSKNTEEKVCFNYQNKQQKWQKSHEIAQIYNEKKKVQVIQRITRQNQTQIFKYHLSLVLTKDDQ